MFQSEPPEKVLKDEVFIKSHDKIKEYDFVGVHSAYVYTPIIEELTYGRKMIDVGFGTKNNMEYFGNRGWIPFGIDSNKDIKETDRIFKDDFETTDKLYKNNYDLVWMSFVLEKFHNPIGALQKAWDLLHDDGILYIATADIDFLFTDPGSWPHWKKKENYILWSQRSLVRELKRIGFEIIVQRRNFASRFGYHHDVQIIAQKPYF